MAGFGVEVSGQQAVAVQLFDGIADGTQTNTQAQREMLVAGEDITVDFVQIHHFGQDELGRERDVGQGQNIRRDNQSAGFTRRLGRGGRGSRLR